MTKRLTKEQKEKNKRDKWMADAAGDEYLDIIDPGYREYRDSKDE